ncbi:MAG: carbohydrate kinase family protein [Tepidisphaeraceae bacterium]
MDVAILGNIVADILASPMDLRAPPPPGGLQSLRSLILATGGSVCNVGLALRRLGMTVGAAGLVGEDALGSMILDRLREAGVDVACVRTEARFQTSATVVAVEPTGERTFFHTPGMTSLVDAAMFRRCAQMFRTCAWLHIGYFGLLPSLTTDLPGLLAELRTQSPTTRISLDTANPPSSRELLDAILPHLDLFAPSRPEAIALTGETDPARMVARFRRAMPGGLIGIKLDRDGCHLDAGGVAHRVPAYEVSVMDTTGAGDAWFAGLLCALSREMPLEQCGRLANRVAADCCTALGAVTGICTLDQTLAHL